MGKEKEAILITREGIKGIVDAQVSRQNDYLLKPLIERQEKELQQCQLRCQWNGLYNAIEQYGRYLPLRVVKLSPPVSSNRVYDLCYQVGVSNQPEWYVNFNLYGCFYRVIGDKTALAPVVGGINTEDVKNSDALTQIRIQFENAVVKGDNSAPLIVPEGFSIVCFTIPPDSYIENILRVWTVVKASSLGDCINQIQGRFHDYKILDPKMGRQQVEDKFKQIEQLNHP